MLNSYDTKTISISNQKGGVGKTTTAINLGSALALANKKVLIIDLDSQKNATTGLGISTAGATSYELLLGHTEAKDAIIPTNIANLYLIPSSVNLSGAEIELTEMADNKNLLKEALKPLHNQYDYILIDCPPALGHLTLNALCASSSVMVPLQCEFYALEGLSHLLKTIARVQKNLNPNLKMHGIVLTMYDKRNNLSDLVAHDVKKHLGNKVYQTIIPRNVKISEAPSHGKPAILYDRTCPGSIAYTNLANELLTRDNQRVGASA